MKEKNTPALDWFRLAAAVLVITIHTSPLAQLSAAGDFWLTRVLARVAVPFFLMVTGHFLKQNPGRFLRKTGALYAAAILLYLPLNLYAGDWRLPEFARQIFFQGTFYHLWYFPAVMLGAVLVLLLRKMGRGPALCAAGALYLIGLGGDSYYGFVQNVPLFHSFYEGMFALFGYTRNGLFFVPLFLLLGAEDFKWSRVVCAAGFAVSLAAMSAEAFWLRSLGVQRHDSMYLVLPVCMVFLFGLLLRENRGQCKPARDVSMLVYLLHPWCIVAVRGVAKVCGLRAVLVDLPLVHFILVTVLSFFGAYMVRRLWPRRSSKTARAWREIDCEALTANAYALRRQAGCPLMAVIKADAYGHGAVLTARALQRAGVDSWAVACLSEGIALRRAGIRGRILILGYTAPSDAPLLVRWHLTQTLADEAHARALSGAGWPVRVHLALDTGMHRLGVPAQNTKALLEIFRLPNIRVDGIFSHLCVSDEDSSSARRYTAEQTALFWSAVERLRSAGVDVGQVHLHASYGVLNQPPEPCSWVRAGIALYGVYSGAFAGKNDVPLRPVLSLRARVASVREIAAGQGAGYGLAFVARRTTRLAVVTIGYADGLPRNLPEKGGRVLICGRFAPMVGRLCMDQMLVDVTDVPSVQAGDKVTLIGKDGAEEIRAEELALRCGTISNELLAGLSPRLALCTSIKQNRKDYDSTRENGEGETWIYRFWRTISFR